jgi:uncharacterized protein
MGHPQPPPASGRGLLNGRYPALDGLRGLAVMGILLMNIAAFALPDAAYSNPRAYGARSASDYLVWALEFLLVDGKMRALFSTLFGASMLLVIRHAEAAEQDSQQVHFRRTGWLLVFGLAHALLVWHGDILVLYALVGCIAWLFVERSNRTLLRYALALFALQFLIMLALTMLTRDVMLAARAPGASEDAIRAWRGINAVSGLPTASEVQAQIALYRGPYAELLAYRIARAGPFYQLLYAGPETLAYMLLGLIGLRSGFLSGTWERSRYRQVALTAYALSLPAMTLLAACCFVLDFDAFAVATAVQLAALPFRPIMMIAHAALALSWFAGSASGLKARIAAAGRAAFSNYLGASLLMTSIFYGHGLGLHGALGRTGLLAIVLSTWLLMLLWSKPWLERFQHGPLEWLWRSLVRREFAPMRQTDIATRSQ